MTQDQIMDGMKAKVKILKENKEKTRVDLVTQKYNEQFSINCDETRALKSQLIEKACNETRSEQLVSNIAKHQREIERKEYFDQLLKLDYLQKLHKEQVDGEKRQHINQQQLQILNQQIQYLCKQKEQEKLLKIEQNNIIQQTIQANKLQDERLLAKKIKSQNKTRKELDVFNKARIETKQREYEIELKHDIEFLQHIQAQQKENIQHEQVQKESLKKQVVAYRTHLSQQKERDAAFLIQVQSMYHEEAERAWRVKEAALQRENSARQALMDEIMQSRKEQIKYKGKSKTKTEQTSKSL